MQSGLPKTEVALPAGPSICQDHGPALQAWSVASFFCACEGRRTRQARVANSVRSRERSFPRPGTIPECLPPPTPDGQISSGVRNQSECRRRADWVGDLKAESPISGPTMPYRTWRPPFSAKERIGRGRLTAPRKRMGLAAKDIRWRSHLGGVGGLVVWLLKWGLCWKSVPAGIELGAAERAIRIGAAPRMQWVELDPQGNGAADGPGGHCERNRAGPRPENRGIAQASEMPPARHPP